VETTSAVRAEMRTMLESIWLQPRSIPRRRAFKFFDCDGRE
jgi:hypothetical protein